MRTLLLLALVGAAVAQTVPAAKTGPDGKPYWDTVLDAAKANNLTDFVAAVEENKIDLAPYSAADTTIFIPSNAALEAVKGDTPLADSPVPVLTYHVVPKAALTGARLTDIISKQPSKSFTMVTGQGERINATLGPDGGLLLNDVPVSSSDIKGGKAVIHVLDGIVVPPTLGKSAVAPKVAAEAPDAEAAADNATVTTSREVEIPSASPSPAPEAAPAAAKGSATSLAATTLLVFPVVVLALL